MKVTFVFENVDQSYIEQMTKDLEANFGIKFPEGFVFNLNLEHDVFKLRELMIEDMISCFSSWHMGTMLDMYPEKTIDQLTWEVQQVNKKKAIEVFMDLLFKR